MTSVLFVCTGNIYRSALAEAFARKLGPADLDVSSAGTHATPGQAPPQGVITAAGEVDVALRWHRSRLLDEPTLAAADVVFVADEEHRDWIEAHWPEHATKVELLDPRGGIPDPPQWTSSRPEPFRDGRDRIAQAVRSRLDELAG